MANQDRKQREEQAWIRMQAVLARWGALAAAQDDMKTWSKIKYVQMLTRRTGD